jgi:general secretion pathway protein D
MKSIRRIAMQLAIFASFVWASETVTFNMRDTSIEDFIKTVAKITHKNILIDANVKGKINFIAQEPIEKKDILPLANAILASKGLTIVDEGAFYKVVKASQAAGEGVDVSTDIDKGTVTTVLFPLKNANAAVIRAKIKPLLGAHDKVVSFKESNMLAVTARPRTLRAIKKLIDSIEGHNGKLSTVIRLKYANVKDIYNNVSNMAKKLFPQTIEREKVDVFKDDATNALILIGKKENVRRMIRYIKQLDIKGEDQVQKMYVIRLKNSNVEEMEKILSKLIAQMNDIAQRRAKKGGQPVKKAMVVSDVERNALIVLATGEQIRNIKETIRKIDIPKVQVYVKARIVEIDKNLAEQIGLKYGLNGGAITTNGLFTLNANLGATPLQMSKDLLTFLNTNNTRRIPDGNGGYIIENDPAFKFGNVDKVFALGAQLDFLRKHGAAHILSEPSILCTNNKEAEIYVGQTRSILTQAQQSSQGNSNIVNTYSREDIGLTLKVKPRLSSDNKVTLEVQTTIEDVLENESPAADRPTTTKRDVKTTAIVNNGETIILGGLIKRAGGKGVTKLPILGDIPILGDLFFRHTLDSTRETNVVIYLTPYIVRRSDDLERLKRFLEELEAVQKEYDKLVFSRIENKEGTTKRSPADRILHTSEDTHVSGGDLTSEF